MRHEKNNTDYTDQGTDYTDKHHALLCAIRDLIRVIRVILLNRSGLLPISDAQKALLTVAFRHTISEPNIEAAYQRFRTINDAMDYEAFCDAIAASVRDRLIREPIRLPEGALQCHWRLELTPEGAAAVRSAASRGEKD